MSDENQEIDPALLEGNPSGLDPRNAVGGGMSLKETPRGIKKLNKKGIMIAAGLLGGAAIVATTTFNGTGSAVGTTAQEAVATQARSRPTEAKRDTLWYAGVSDKVAAGEPDTPAGAAPDYLGMGNQASRTGAAGGAAAGTAGAGGNSVPDLTGKAINPIVAATAGKTGAAPYNPAAQGMHGQVPQGGTPAEQAAMNAKMQAEQAEAQQAAQAKQLKQQQLDAAMKGGLAAAGFGDKQAQAATPAAAGVPQSSMAGLPSNMSPVAFGQQQRDDDQNKQERKEQFLKTQAQAVDPEYSPSRKTAARSPFELKAGGLIPAVLISGLNSDLPGEAIAQVRENVYDTKTGRYLLIPQGARLVGLYDSRVAYGQKRVLLAWNRIIFPDGSSFDLKGMPGADMSGYAGFSDQVDNHYTKIFGSSVLLSLISAGVQLSQPNNGGGGNNNNQPSVSQTVGGALGQQLGQTGMNITQKNLNIQPTLEIRPGYRFNIMVTADMILPPAGR